MTRHRLKIYLAKMLYNTFRKYIAFESYSGPVKGSFSCHVRVFGVLVATLEYTHREIIERTWI